MPKVVVEEQVEGYEFVAIQDEGTYVFAPSYWRALANGTGVEVRAYHEDTDWVRGAMKQRSSRLWEPGEYLSPRFQAVRIYEVLAFVRHLSKAFSGAERVTLIADYNGLNDRIIRDTKAGAYYSLERRAGSASRRIKIEATIESLAGDGTAEVTAQMLNPILRLFDGFEAGPEFVRKAVREIY